MIINPLTAVKEKWLTGIQNDSQIQQNGVDITLDELWDINPIRDFVISESMKKHKGGTKLEPTIISGLSEEIPFWHLTANQIYDGTSKAYVNLPDGVCAYLITRSTCSRNGVNVFSGWWDTGFKGHLSFTIRNFKMEN